MSDEYFSTYPEAPEDQQPKPLYHTGDISLKMVKQLQKKGWDPIDLRLLPSSSDAEREDTLKKWLEAIRVGSVPADQSTVKFLDMEIRMLRQSTAPEKQKLDKKSIDDLLAIGKKSTTKDKEEKPKPAKKKRGRPRKSLSKVEL